MDAERIITIVSFVLTIAAFAWGLYEKVKGDSTAAVSGLIATAEETGLVGTEKMQLVVGWLYDMIPAVFKKTLNKEALQALAQRIFDYMKKYANAYIDSHHGGGSAAYAPVNDELAEETAKALAGAGSAALRTLAVNFGFVVEGKEDDEIIKEIILALMAARNENAE